MALDNSIKKIAVDAMGGDFAPEEVVKGAISAAKQYGISSILVGYEDKIRAELEKNKARNLPIEVCHAPEVIEMGEEPFHMIRKKKQSSLRVAFELVRHNEAQALMSAGNSGAVVYGALFVLKRIKNINRPGIATLMPTLKERVMVLDAGANTVCRPQNLAQFALMGSVYFQQVFGIPHPKVGVLSNGEEETKGNDLTRGANELLKKSSLNYVGYAEGKDVFSGDVDIVVCDGFVGNVLLKVAEGIAESMIASLRGEIKSRFFSQIGYLLSKPSFVSFKKRVDYAEYGGAPLLGVDKPVIIAHGKSNDRAVMNAIRVAHDYVEKDVVGKLIEEVERDETQQGLKKGHPFLDKIFHHGRSEHQ